MTAAYYIILIIAVSTIAITSLILYRHLKSGDEMLGMMAGMITGMLAGVTVGTFILLPTGDFLAGVMIGSIVGVIFGVPIGRFGGIMGTMEGFMAGWMGGMMGAMLGQMMRPFNLNIFMPFFFILFFITLGGLIYLVYTRCEKCVPLILTRYGSIIAGIILIGIANLDFSITPKITSIEGEVSASSGSNAAEDEIRQKNKITAAINSNGIQEVEIFALSDGYHPSEIIVKNNVPVHVTLKAGKYPGCFRNFYMQSLRINKIIPKEGAVSFDFTPNTLGEMDFTCSMGMSGGKFIVAA